LDTSTKEWAGAAQAPFSFKFLYQNDAGQLLFWSRVPMVLIAALGAVVTFLWARDLFGDAAGLFALGLYAFSPNLLAHSMLVTTDMPLASFAALTLYLVWKQPRRRSWRNDAAVGLALGAAMTVKFSGALLPILLAGFAGLRVWRSENRSAAARTEIRGLSVAAAASLLAIEAAYLFSASPLLYFRNLAFVNANHNPEYFFYLFDQLKQGGWWYYFLLAFAVKATLPLLILILLATVRATNGLKEVRGEAILLATIAAYTAVISLWAHPLGIRYLLPVFPLLFVWVSRLVPECLTARAGQLVLGVLLLWQAWAGLSAFPNYIPYFNEAAGGAAKGIDYLDDSNVDWGQGLKQAAEYVRERGLKNVAIYSFSPLDNPLYYGLPANVQTAQVRDLLLFKRPRPGVYIISAHHIARMRQVDPAWRSYTPVERIGVSLWVYSF
jgi:4-amino-4-deoxy-L-arabinose transferase-like glycosyltransferase